MTLDDIQTSIHQGTKGIEHAIEKVSEYVNKNQAKQNIAIVKSLNVQAESIYKTMPSGFLNRLAMSGKIGDLIKKYDGFSPKNQRIDPTMHVRGLHTYFENEANREIIHAKEPHTKLNKEKEKKWLLDYITSNYSSLVQLYTLHNKLLDIKDAINA
jgi:hypothetical protein